MMNAGTGEASRRKTIFMSNDGRDKNKELEASRFSLEPAYKSSLRDGIRENLKKPLSRKPKRQQLYYLYRIIMNRRKFHYTLKHVFKYYFKCIWCRSNKAIRQLNDGKRDLYYGRAERKLAKDLDVITLLQMIQSAEIVQSILFDKNARQLLQFQRKKVVTASSDVASDPFDERMRLDRIFTEENMQDREAYRGELKKLLGHY